jgi:tellurite resistance protein
MVYLRTLRVAMEDNIVTDDEMAILNILANCIGLDEETAKFASAILNQIEKSPITSAQEKEWSYRHIGDATCYQSALIAALDDEVISDDEMAMLDCLRRAMGLQPNEHALVEESIRVMIENQGDDRLMTRLESYLTSFPGV